jgi:hypothetical protein
MALHSHTRQSIACITIVFFVSSCSQKKDDSSERYQNAHGETPVTTIDSTKIHSLKTQNFPPQWEKSPRNIGIAGKPFCDTLFAVDPEGSPVMYSLIKGPLGLTLDTQSGVIRFFPKSPGVFAVEVSVSDTSQFSTKMEYELTISTPSLKVTRQKPTVIHNVPSVVAPNAVLVEAKPIARFAAFPESPFVNKECVLDASRSTHAFTVRWDFDNNGTWDYPPSGGFSLEKSVKKIWTSPGKYSVVLEIKDGSGVSGFATADIIVRAEKQAPPPVIPSKPPILLSGGPYQSHVNKPIDFNGAVKNPGDRIAKYEWDFLGKGQFEWSSPITGKTNHVYTKSGIYKPVFRVTTKEQKQWSDTASVTIINSPPRAHAGKPVLSKKGRNLKLRGTGEDVDGRIVLYEWDFNGDGTYDWSSSKNGIVNHEFDAYSYAILRVTDDDGATATDTLRVVICPEGMESVENGPYCIDAYEWPNQAGKEPQREITFFDAEKKCAEIGKHLCTSHEWENACSGSERQEYPKSSSPAVQTCNVIGNRYFPNKVAPNGSFSDCKSPVGAFDMNGNVAEWTQGGAADSAFVYGGSWHNDVSSSTCSSKFLLKKDKGYFYVGFRCCK